jgi:hypothetical protein
MKIITRKFVYKYGKVEKISKINPSGLPGFIE